MFGFLKKLFGKGDGGAPVAPVAQGPNPGVPGAVDQVSPQSVNPTVVAPSTPPPAPADKPA